MSIEMAETMIRHAQATGDAGTMARAMLQLLEEVKALKAEIEHLKKR
jgi:hypothetical protein